MHFLLAQVPTAPAREIASWLISAAAVLLILERGFSFWKNHLREEPSPSATYWRKLDGEKAISELDARLKQQDEYGRARRQAIYEEFKKIRCEMTDMAGEIYETVKPLAESMSAMKEADGTSKERLRTIEGDIKTLLRRSA